MDSIERTLSPHYSPYTTMRIPPMQSSSLNSVLVANPCRANLKNQSKLFEILNFGLLKGRTFRPVCWRSLSLKLIGEVDRRSWSARLVVHWRGIGDTLTVHWIYRVRSTDQQLSLVAFSMGTGAINLRTNCLIKFLLWPPIKRRPVCVSAAAFSRSPPLQKVRQENLPLILLIWPASRNLNFQLGKLIFAPQTIWGI